MRPNTTKFREIAKHMNKIYDAGYNAFIRDVPFNPVAHQEWRAGWNYAASLGVKEELTISRDVILTSKIDYNDPMNGYRQYTVGLRVFKNAGDEKYYGTILSRFLTLDRQLRFVLEVEGTGILKTEKGLDLYWINQASEF